MYMYMSGILLLVYNIIYYNRYMYLGGGSYIALDSSCLAEPVDYSIYNQLG